MDTRQVVNEALKLAPTQRAALIEALLASFDSGREGMDALWAAEVESRIDAHDSGALAARSADQVFADIEDE